MTPRSLKPQSQPAGQEFTRSADGQPPTKKFRASAAPKGSRLASGYVDRARERSKQTEDDERYERLKNLEKLLKDEEIDQATFDRQREELGIGGDVSSTHLVKGLDFKLLERVRRGEDINAKTEEPENAEKDEEAPVNEVDVEDELERALERDVEALSNKKTEADTAEEAAEAAPTVALSRDEILRQMKERRKNPQAIQAPPQPVLDQSRFKKLEPAIKSNKRKFTESINGRRREVLVITNKDGTTKRKTRWLDPEPDPSATKTEPAAWGSDLPEQVIARQKAAEEAASKALEDDDDDGDIFGGVADYDPLAGLDSDSEAENKATDDTTTKENAEQTADPPTTSKPLKSTSGPRNYFNASNTEEEQKYDPRNDPSILAALKRAAQLRQQEETESNGQEQSSASNTNPEDEARNRALLKKLQQQSGQDDVDVDMSFGGDGRFDEEEDEGALSKQKLSQWKGLGQEGDEEEDDAKNGAKDKEKRKRGGKKKMGDKNSFADVMSVLEGRKK